MSSAETPAATIAPQPWMIEAETRAVLATLGLDEARFVGGSVRDALLDRAILDIDIATRLLPEEVMRRLAAARIAAVPTGLAHGTVTAVLSSRHFEITTLRRDVETYGRHARVAFTTDWAEDARRRDFTMNALYLDEAGRVFDPVSGLADLRAGTVRFVGDPATRIREDVLRLLRFYRFYAHYGRGPADRAARDAAHDAAHLVPGLSAERVAAELVKLLAAPDPAATLDLMREDGVLAVLLPEARDLGLLKALVAIEPAPDPVRRLAALIAADGVAAVAARLKLSSAVRTRLAMLAVPPWPMSLAAGERTQRRALYHLGAALYRDLALLEAAARGGDASDALALAEDWQAPRFPLRGRDVTARQVPAGPEVGRLLGAVKEWWEAVDFSADRKACLAELDRLIAALR